MLNGFPSYIMDLCVERVLNRYHAGQRTSHTDPGVQRRELVVALPFLGPLSLVIRRRLLRLVHKFYPTVDMKVVFRRGFRIANLFNYKDKFPLACKSMVVYYICCKHCGPSQAYIGKTVATVYEHFHASGSGHLHPNNVDSALLQHLNESGDPECAFSFEDVKILEAGRYDQEIRFIESILLKYDRQNLNTCERSIKLNIV